MKPAIEVPSGKSVEIASRLGALRAARGFSAAGLAASIGVSRQAIYAIEAGTYTPNTAVALKMAQIFAVQVEDIFSLDEPPAMTALEPAEPLDELTHATAGASVRLCRVNERLVAADTRSAEWELPLADGVVRIAQGRRSLEVEPIEPARPLDNRVLLAGCDPGASILARHMQRQGVELVVAQRNSSKALDLLKRGTIHVAGCHFHDANAGKSNRSAIESRFKWREVAVVSLAAWEEGLVVRRGNPKNIVGIADLGRRDVTLVNREPGAASRIFLDARMRGLGLNHREVRGYGSLALGHLQAARQVLLGAADCCIATGAAARVLGLGFIALAAARYDLVVLRRHVQLKQLESLFDTLALAAFRRELACVGGYDTSIAGNRVM